MSKNASLCVHFSDETVPVIRARITYALRVFAAIHGFRFADDHSAGDTICIRYGIGRPLDGCWRSRFVPARYRSRPSGTSRLAPSKHSYAGEEFPLFWGVDGETGKPDWPGEIFEWLSCNHELEAKRRDAADRIPFSESVFGKERISPRRPYAGILMAWMMNALSGNESESSPAAPSPIHGTEHAVVCCHDIDFYHTHRVSTLLRLLKNLGISYALYRSWPFFRSNARMLLELLSGKRVGDYLPPLLEASGRYGFKSTIFVVPQQKHRRDPNYSLKTLASRLSDASREGFPIEVHGSYTSIVESQTLTPEVAALNEATGRRPIGSRQHWLRFDRHEKLFAAVERAGLAFDSSICFAETVGFRSGANFAYPPYNFAKEEPYNFLEIPVVLMDGNLEAAARANGGHPQTIADGVLQQSRRWGWGGIAAIWHNPIEPIQVPPEINDVFWECVREQERFREKWMSATEFLDGCLSRYQDAGLLQGLSVHA